MTKLGGAFNISWPCRICDDFTFDFSRTYDVWPMCKTCQHFVKISLENEDLMCMFECEDKTEDCVITPFNRTRCPFCRLQKYYR